ncbi:MAG TPA: DEAD/DEAH box helicase, partial [Treponemataceae bacterium]|nr:DEAD/DEAH box helicase [Treponemataceae bacterium]
VTAKVKGSYYPWYKVTLEFPGVASADIEKIQKIIADNPLIAAQLEQNEYSSEFAQLLKEKKITLIPSRWSKISRTCNCPDSGDPCKHMAAVLYLLAQEIDSQPKMLFSIAGMRTLLEMKESSPDTSSPALSNAVKTGKKRTAKKTDTSLSEPSSHDASSIEKTDKLTALPSIPIDSFLNRIQAFLPENSSLVPAEFKYEILRFYHLLVNDAYTLQEKSSLYEEDEYKFQLASFEPKIRSGAVDVKYGNEKKHTMTLIQLMPFFIERLGSADAAKKGSDSYLFFTAFFALILKCFTKGALLPVVRTGESLFVEWTLPSNVIEIEADKKLLLEKIPSSWSDAQKNKDAFLQNLLSLFCTSFVHSQNFTVQIKHIPQYPEAAVLAKVFFSPQTFDCTKPGKRAIPHALSQWLKPLDYSVNPAFRFQIKILDEAESEEEDSFILEAGVKKQGDSEFIPLNALAKNSSMREALSLPVVLSSFLPELKSLVSKPQTPVDSRRLLFFLQDASSFLETLNIQIVIPKALQKILKPRIEKSVSETKEEEKEKQNRGSLTSYLGLANLLDYDEVVMLGNTKISRKELAELVAQNRTLVKFKNTYVQLDPEEMTRLLARTAKPQKVTSTDILKGYFSNEFSFSKKAKSIINAMLKDHTVSVPHNLNASLRPYQKRGFEWLYSNVRNNFGCVLADDMGLGKTLQIITLMLALKNEGLLHTLKDKNKEEHGALIIAPASLMINWQKEIEKFAPSLSYKIYHGAGRKLDSNADVHISTYGTIQADAEKLTSKKFSLLVMDEAQAVKNATSKRYRAVRSVLAKTSIAMTGTPVENTLEDLRAVFDLLLPGYLGGAKEFTEKWRKPIELHNNKEIADELKKITGPFMLRRLKTDKTVIADLPEKVTENQYASMSALQTALYKSVTEEAMEKIREKKADIPIQRSAIILSLLTSLKQICSHPRVYDKESPAKSLLSGKAELLLSLLHGIRSNGEKVLIFSQYVSTIETLQTIIEKEMHEQTLIFHGGMTRQKRGEAVEDFQKSDGPAVFLISLKAGGTGLNLTSANHVIHYDLWFNPAVEDQATDRAFRIGQNRNVFVHRLICDGTFEEKIDQMIQKKRAVQDLTVQSGEKWLTKLSDEELLELFQG